MFGWLRGEKPEVGEAEVVAFLVRTARNREATGEREKAQLFKRCALVLRVEAEERQNLGAHYDEWGGHQ